MDVEGKSRVFVVSGRDHAAHDTLVNLLTAWHVHVVDWEEAIARTRRPAAHAFEALEAVFRDIDAVLVLLTGDDEARLRPSLLRSIDRQVEDRLLPQPRPNVLVEAGIALGLRPRATVLIQVGRLRPVSDLAGLQVVMLDESAASHKVLASRLRIAGVKLPPGPLPAVTAVPAMHEATAELPALGPGPARLSLLKRVRSLFSGPRMGGAMEIVSTAKPGARLKLALRLDPSWAQSVSDIEARHWLPGAAESDPVGRFSPVPASGAAVGDVDDVDDGRGLLSSAQLTVRLGAEAGVHVFDAVALTADGERVIARTTCVVDGGHG